MFANSNSPESGTGPNRSLSSEAWKTRGRTIQNKAWKPVITQHLRTSQPGRIAWHELCEQIGEDWLELCGGSREPPPWGEEHAVPIPSHRPVEQGVAGAERQLLGVRGIEPHDFVEGVLGDL